MLQEAIPAQYRDAEHHWFGISRRSPVIVYAKDRVKLSDFSTYEDLADPIDLHTPHWHGNAGLLNGRRVDVVELLPASRW